MVILSWVALFKISAATQHQWKQNNCKNVFVLADDLGALRSTVRSSLVAPPECGEGAALSCSNPPVLADRFGTTISVWLFCIAPESLVKESAMPLVTKDEFPQAEWGSSCWEQSIFLAFSLCSGRSLMGSSCVFCGNCGLLFDHSANLYNWSMWMCWYFS